MYFPNISGESSQMQPYSLFAKEVGAGGLLVMLGLYSFDSVWQLRSNDEIGLPIMTHSSFLGPYVLSENTGFSHAVMFGFIQRLCGSDMSVILNFGGRFGFSREECSSFAKACQVERTVGKPILPSPGGGMTTDKALDMKGFYGNDSVLLLGGSLLQHSKGITADVKEVFDIISN